MKLLSRLLSCACVALALQAPGAHAEQYFNLQAGSFNFNDQEGKSSANFAGEWHGNPFYYGFLPVVGLSVNTDSGVYGYAGINYDWEFSPNWVLTPGVAVGAWHQGDSEDLGGWLEFKESLELDYRFNNNYRVGLQVNHISNADIYNHNPGQNGVMATVSIPFGY